MIAKPKILIAIRESLYRDLIGVENEGRLRQSGSLTFAARDENLTSAQLAQEIPALTSSSPAGARRSLPTR